MGEQGPVFHGDADAERDVKSVAKVNVAGLATLDRQAMGFGHLLAGGHEIPAQALAQAQRQVARRRHL